MAAKDSVRYTVGFAAAVCVVCALLVASASVALQPRQDANARLYMQKNVLLAAGLADPGADLTEAQLRRIFDERIVVRLVDFATGQLVPAERIDAAGYDQRRARNDPAQSRAAPANRAGIARVPNYGVVYFVKPASGSGPVEQVVLAIEGLAFYEQKETPGLGGEISNPKWQALWRGRKAYDAQWQPRLTVVKGAAGPVDSDPHRIDGLSGATITSNAITRLVQFWLSDDGYGRWLKKFRAANGGQA